MEVSRTQVAIIGALLASIACLILAPGALTDAYSVVSHTTSEAAAQGTQGAWLARTGFLLFGLGVFWLSIAKRNWAYSARVLHGAFGILLIASAVYSHRPVVEGADYDAFEDTLHSIAATSMGFVFAMGVLIVGWRRVSGWKIIDVVALSASVVVPLAMLLTTGWDGLWQRGMFAIAYVWYIVEAVDTHRSTALDAFS
jgi:hypothetical protein